MSSITEHAPVTTGSTPNISLGRLHIAASDQSISELNSGDHLTLTVVERNTSNSNIPKIERGVIINGEFHAVELPPEIKPGTKVELEVTSTPPDLRLQFNRAISESEQPTEAVEPQPIDLKTLLQTLTQKIIRETHSTESTLSKLIIESHQDAPSQNQTASKSDHSIPTPELLRKLAVVTDKEIKDPRQLAETLRTQPNQPALTELARRSAEQQTIISKSSVPRQAEIVRTVVLQLEKLTNSQPSTPTTKNITIEPTTNSQRTSQTQTTPPPQPTRTPTIKLLDTLQSVRTTAVEVQHTTSTELKKVVQSQIVKLEKVEPQAKAVLLSQQSDSPLKTLLNVVTRAITEPIDDKIPQQVAYKLLLIELQSQITKWIETQLTKDQTLPHLEKFLTRLYTELGLTPDSDRLNLPLEKAEPPPGLTRQQFTFLRVIEANLRSILEQGDNKEFTLTDFRTSKIISILNSISDDLPATILEKLPNLELITRTFKQLQTNSTTASPTAMRDLIRNAANELRQFLQQPTAANLVNVSGAQPTSEITKIVSEIERTIEALRSTLPPTSNPSTTERQLTTSQPSNRIQGEIASIKLNLERIISQTTQSIDEAQFDLGSMAHEILDQITSRENSNNPFTHNELRKIATQLRTKFLGGAPESLPNTSLFDTQTIQALTNSLAARQGMEQLAPLARNAGEPLLILFPMLLHGHVSQIEVRLLGNSNYPDKGSNVENQQGSKERSGSGAPFQRLQVSVTLPTIGEVSCDLAHRKEELLLNLSFQNQAIATFIESRLGKLEAAFGTLGFRNCTIRSVVLTNIVSESASIESLSTLTVA